MSINYFSTSQSKVVSTFLCLIKLDKSDVISITTALKDTLKVMRKNHNNLIGIGIVQLAVNHASKIILPGDLEFLIYETYNWFSKRSKRQMDYRRIYQVINNDKV